MLDDELLIKYFLNKANILSLEYEEQIKKAFELDMGDYYTEDIANDWLSEDIKILNELVKKNLINKKALESQIDKNFIEVSLNGKLYKKEIWTLKALKNDLFWKKQRILAKQFINELLNK
mgnify:CR=1 FL=1